MKKIVLLASVFLSILGCETKGNTTAFSVASYNIRFYNNGDSLHGNAWSLRGPVIAGLVRHYAFDIMGTQECLASQLRDLQQALPEYAYFGVGRDDGKQGGEHAAIFYRKDKFDLLDHGDFWLSKTPDVPSIGWDAVLPRVCSWGHFKCKDSGFEFLFFNLHMDHIGAVAQVESAKLVQQKISELGENLPFILTGDFNVDQHHPSYAKLIASGVFRDSYEVCDERYAPNGTFNDFQPKRFTTSRIDHVFVSRHFHVKSYAVHTDMYWTEVPQVHSHTVSADSVVLPLYRIHTPSDHYPVQVELECNGTDVNG